MELTGFEIFWRNAVFLMALFWADSSFYQIHNNIYHFNSYSPDKIRETILNTLRTPFFYFHVTENTHPCNRDIHFFLLWTNIGTLYSDVDDRLLNNTSCSNQNKYNDDDDGCVAFQS